MELTYKLLTPGPLTTTRSVKEQMLFDHCTWDDDYKRITQDIRAHLLRLAHVAPERYTAVLMQGSGTFGNESVLTSVVGDDERVLVCANGAYGDRLAEICRQAGVPVTVYAEPYDTPVDAQRIAAHLAADPSITHVAMVHNETTSGLVNDIEAAGAVAKRAGAAFIVDAMSSFGGIDIPVEDWGIDFIVSSANKCIQGVPGFSFAICRRDLLEGSRGKARSLSLDLYAQWQTMERDGGKWRFTSPTNAVLAFAQALRELEEEGGATLSGGERQRLSIARAILKDAPIVILDEATANVDPENERDLQRAIAELTRSKTVIMIAHRLKTVRDADQIVVLDGGRIVQRGTHDALMAEGGLYADFVGMRERAIGWKLGGAATCANAPA